MGSSSKNSPLWSWYRSRGYRSQKGSLLLHVAGGFGFLLFLYTLMPLRVAHEDVEPEAGATSRQIVAVWLLSVWGEIGED